MAKGSKSLLTLGLMIVLTVLMGMGAYASQVGIGKVTGSAVNVRSMPALNSARLTQLTKGTDVLILGRQDGWYQISVNGGVGYMSIDYVAKQADGLGEFGYGLVQQDTPLCDRPDEDQIGLTMLTKGQGLKIIGAEGGWFRVQLGEQKGYLPEGSLLPITPTAEMIAVYAAHAPGRVVVETAKKYIGVRYVYGGTSPKTGFDCSGLVQYVFKESINFTFTQRTSQYKDGIKISYAALQPGDLVTFATGARRRISHIGIYIGDGKMIHSPRPGASVRIDDMTSGYYYTRFHSAYRIVK